MPDLDPSLTDWIAREAIPFSLDSADSFNSAVDRMMSAMGESVQLLGIGEPTHGMGIFLELRNRLFHRLVEKHGFSAIAVESSFPRGRVANEYVSGGAGPYAAVKETGFSHGFGAMDQNRALIEWMRQYNRDSSHSLKLHFYGFDAPTEMTSTDSPRRLIQFALDYLTEIDEQRRQRIENLVGNDAAWENRAAVFDASQSIGLSENAKALRLEVEDLIAELELRRPELIARSDKERFLEAAQYASAGRQLLNYHAEAARASDDRIARMLGLRDAMMADNLAYIVAREQRRGGRVLAFAHNSHLKRGQAHWQLGPHALCWWPAGAHMHELLESRYAVIGVGLGTSQANGITAPEPQTLEALLLTSPGPARLIPTHRAQHLPASAIDSLVARTGTQTFFPFTPKSIEEFDWLAVLDSV